MSAAPSNAGARDLRIDFFRGIAMFIIFVSHVPFDTWGRYIPARFGPSDGADIFVFCSGFASAIAFGTVFTRRSFLLGTARIVFRFWQIYWTQICLFIVTAVVVIVGNQVLDGRDYVQQLNLYPFFEDPMAGMVGLITLTYVPNYFDILPMYMMVLLMVPLAMALKRLHVGAVVAASLGVWASTKLFGLNLPADVWTDRPWFFNPFAWQLVFFTGFAFGSGWIRPPEPKRWLMLAAFAFVVVMVPLTHWDTVQHIAWVQAFRELTWDWTWGKLNYGLFRWLHLLALAYLMRCLLLGHEAILERPWLAPIIVVGQNALAVFVFSIVLARIAGMVLDEFGRDPLTTGVVNLTGFMLLVVAARTSAWFKSNPWRQRPAVGPVPERRAEARSDEERGRGLRPAHAMTGAP